MSADVLPRVVITPEALTRFVRAAKEHAAALVRQGASLDDIGEETGAVESDALVITVPVVGRAPWRFTIQPGEWDWSQ